MLALLSPATRRNPARQLSQARAPRERLSLALRARGHRQTRLQHRSWVYGNTNEAIGLRPGQPTEMRSDVPSHVTSVTTTTTAAAIAMVRRRGMLGRSSQFG